ncbi:MAG: Rpn family recombination-promoting nuclease/putative transposase, partial [Eubacterium sp.]|nr:Rpn family recombination-promoting nuclease/putative transposase [Eubacterium sp.]
MTSANRKYKDSVFCKLFSDKERFLELYGAIEGKVFPKDTKIEETTLENVLFMERRNDLSFLVDNKLVVMLEHQSTVNNNMPLRFLLYAAYIYENIIDGKNVYRTRLMKIPEPEFIVIYNGRENYDKKTILKLSDAFYENKHKQLELEVRIININEDKNPEILAKSKSLEGYSKLVGVTEKLRRQGESLDEAINKALKYCIDNNFLRDFITQNYREVGSMLRTEFNLDDAKIIWRMEGIEEGIE